jgi:hypothetical protein
MLIHKNDSKQRFETALGKEFAYIDFRIFEGNIVLIHTFVPLEGRGLKISEQLAEFVFDYLKSHQLKMKVYCPYLLAYLEKNPKHKELLV